MNKTSIEWVKNPDGSQGYTWNPITGCLNNCSYCYARKLANGRLQERYLSNFNLAPDYQGLKALDDPFWPRFWLERLKDIKPSGAWWDWRKPKGIFVCDMGELFGPWVPREWQVEIFDYIRSDPDDRFYLLTKQPQELIKWSPFPANCWVGVTATNTQSYIDATNYLANIEAKVKYLSFEPLLERLNCFRLPPLVHSKAGWIIIGAQTRPYKPPPLQAVWEIVEAADKEGIPIFLKDNLEPLLKTLNVTGGTFGRLTSLNSSVEHHGCRKREWYQLRQKMPGEHSLENIKRR